MRTLESRLRDRVERIEYQKDFKKIKRSILLLKEQKKYIRGIYPVGFTRIEPSHQEDTAIRHGKIPLKELQSLLKKGNVNDHRILIPDTYSDFKSKYGLRCLFDPAKPYPKFNPFNDRPIVAELPLDFGTRITMTVDISFPLGMLEEHFKTSIKHLKKMWKLKEKRKERYSDNEVYKVKKFIQEGFSDTEIFRKLYPKYKDFRFTKDYAIGGSEVGKYYQRMKRLIKRAKERKS